VAIKTLLLNRADKQLIIAFIKDIKQRVKVDTRNNVVEIHIIALAVIKILLFPINE